jgi:hypothetical protein
LVALVARPGVQLGAQQFSLVTDAHATASPYSATIGTRRVFICRPNLPLQSVWGTDVYTDDSSICSAAVHAGVITLAQGGVVTIVIGAGQESFSGSTRNGVTSTAWAAHERSYTFDRATPARGQIDWGTSAAGLPRGFTTPLELTCPAGSATIVAEVAAIYGTDIYSDTSPLCVAALHAGLIPLSGGAVQFVSRGTQLSFAASTRNGVTSRAYGVWDASFSLGAASAVSTATTSVTAPTSAGVTAGPLPSGSVTSPSAAIATQSTVSSPTNPLPVVSPTTQQSQQAQTATSTSTATSSTLLPSEKTLATTTLSTAPGPAPTNVKAVATSMTSAALSWDVAAGVRYLIERRQADNPACCVAQSGYLTMGSWQDVDLVPGTEYTFAITALYPDGRTGSTQVMMRMPYPAVSLGAVAYTACVQRRSAGPDPGVVAPAGSQSPAGASLKWNESSPEGTSYRVDRAPYGTTAWTFIGSTCGGPSPIAVGPRDPTTGKSQIWVRDLAGSVVAGSKYTYRVTRIGPSSEVGWQTLAWVAPCAVTPSLKATVSGSTVTIGWTPAASSWCSTLPVMKPEKYTLTSSFGYVKVRQASGTDTYFTEVIYGVPVGTHTFSLVSGWYPDASTKPSSVSVTVSY